MRSRNLFFLPEVLTRAEILALGLLLVIVFSSLMGLISETVKAYGVAKPAFGGTITEAVVGKPRFINPLLAQTDADKDLVALIYAGLLRYDGRGNLAPQLAKSYEISPDGLTYTVSIKENLYWSDGEPLTIDDVIFTIQLAKNPLAQSPRRPNWEGVETEKIDAQTIKFRLRRAYAPFLDNLTLGILPFHVWADIPPSQIPLVEINTNPIGAGPYKIKNLEKDSVGSISSINLAANRLFAEGKPNIKNIILKFYNKEEEAVESLKKGLADSLGSVSSKYLAEFSKQGYNIKSLNLQRIIAIFLNKDAKKTLANDKIRRALDLGLNKEALVQNVLHGYGQPISGPLPNSFPEEKNKYDPATAQTLIKDSELDVELTITTAGNEKLTAAAEFVKKDWESIGVKVDIKTFALEDLEQLVIGPRRYDTFLYGEDITGENPDLFPFWHSSQRTHPGYNIALYANSKADKTLENIRSEQNKEKRNQLYEDLQNEITKDTPAIFLFSPHYVYIAPRGVQGIELTSVNTGAERFSEVHKWYLNKKHVWKIFAE